MDPVNPKDLRADLHRLVDRLFDAPPAELKAALTQLVRLARLSAQVRAYQEGRAIIPAAAPATPVLEGLFVRLLAGGKFLFPGGEHLVPEADVTAARLQHGDLVTASPADGGGYTYRAWSGPLVDKAAVHTWGHVEPLDEDQVLVRTPQGQEITVAWHDMKGLGATLDDVLKVAYLPEHGQHARYLGRILEIARPPDEPVGTAQPPADRKSRRRLTELPPGSGRPEGPLPQFLSVEGRRPRIAIVGGHPPSRHKYAEILARYGADLHWLPYSPKVKKVRHAVQKSDIVIGMTHCCRTGQWESAVESSRTYGKLWFCAVSENESGLCYQLKQEIIPKWNERFPAGQATS